MVCTAWYVGGVGYCSRCFDWNCVHASCYCYCNLKPAKFCTTDTTYVCLLRTILFLYVLKKFWCQLPEDGNINKAYTCMSYTKDSMHKLQISAFVYVTSVFSFFHNAQNKLCIGDITRQSKYKKRISKFYSIH
jgi:hypothetical protein